MPIAENAEGPAGLLARARESQEAGRFAEAAALFAERAAKGGDDEESWYARWQESRCLLKLGDEVRFVSAALAAFNMRPRRAEPLYDLARFYRERGMNATSLVFSERGLEMIPPAGDRISVEDHIYTAGLREEFAVAANHVRDPLLRSRGQAACNWLALNRDLPSNTRNLARWNLGFYCRAAGAVMPSFAARPIGFAAPAGFRSLNPSVARLGDRIMVIQAVARSGESADPEVSANPIRHFLLSLDADLDVLGCEEILPSEERPQSDPSLDPGFEEPRLFSWRGALCCTSTSPATNDRGGQVLARIAGGLPDTCRFAEMRMLPANDRESSKSWIPRAAGEELRFIGDCDPTLVVDEQGRWIVDAIPPIAAAHFDGGSQAIEFDGGWLALIRDAAVREARHRLHRFVWFDGLDRLRLITRPFFLHNNAVEAAAGLAWHNDASRLVISYGAGDDEAWIATVESEDVRRILDEAADLPKGDASEVSLRHLQLEPQRIGKPAAVTFAASMPSQIFRGRDATALSHPAVLPRQDVAMNGGLGDVLMCTPGLRALKHSQPACRIRFYSHYQDVVGGLAYIDEVHPLAAAPATAFAAGYGPSSPPYQHIAGVIGDSLGVQGDGCPPGLRDPARARRRFPGILAAPAPPPCAEKPPRERLDAEQELARSSLGGADQPP